MRHLIIAAHPGRNSFNHSVVEAYTAALGERGHKVQVRDLYALGFNPVLSARDLTALSSGRFAKDVRAEQALVAKSDVLTFVAPLWWSGFPAMLKGYIDRVFCAGFAYVVRRGDYRPGLSGKKGVIITTSGATTGELRSGGTLRALRAIQEQGLVEFCGIEMLRHLYLSGIAPGMSRSEGERRLQTVRQFVRRTF